MACYIILTLYVAFIIGMVIVATIYVAGDERIDDNLVSKSIAYYLNAFEETDIQARNHYATEYNNLFKTLTDGEKLKVLTYIVIYHEKEKLKIATPMA